MGNTQAIPMPKDSQRTISQDSTKNINHHFQRSKDQPVFRRMEL